MARGLSRRQALVTALGAALYALLFALGSQTDAQMHIAPGETLRRFACALPVALCALCALFGWVFPRMALRDDAPGRKRFCTAGAAALIFLSFVPMFAIYYPGNFRYDIYLQGVEAATGSFSQFHPLLHTLTIWACMKLEGLLGSAVRSAALYTLAQMLALAVCFSLVCASLSRSVSRRAARMATAFFCLYPVHMAFASSCTKDGLFAACFALFAALCMERVRCGGLSRGHAALHVCSGVLACMLRNNMIYAMAAWGLALLLCGRRMRRMALCAALCAALAWAGNAGLAAITHARPGNAVEMLSVPIQQLARAYNLSPEAFTEADRQLLERFAPPQVLAAYDPRISDPVKNELYDGAILDNREALTALWLRVGAKCPGVYLDAFMYTMLPALYPYARYATPREYIEVNAQPQAFNEPLEESQLRQSAWMTALRADLSAWLFDTGADHVPVVRLLFNTGVLFWALLALALFDVYCGRWQRAAVHLLPLLLYATYLLGPVMQARYAYPFMCVLPLFALRPKEEET